MAAVKKELAESWSAERDPETGDITVQVSRNVDYDNVHAYYVVIPAIHWRELVNKFAQEASGDRPGFAIG